jgi:hypothetical protein
MYLNIEKGDSDQKEDNEDIDNGPQSQQEEEIDRINEGDESKNQTDGDEGIYCTNLEGVFHEQKCLYFIYPYLDLIYI